MSYALELAEQAALLGEVPVGALLVREDRILGTGYNRREIDGDSLAHAELLAIQQASKRLGGWRLEHTTLYVTLEPCPMCGGAIINARIPRVVFGAWDPKAGCFGSVSDFTQLPFNHKPEITSGVLEEQAANQLKAFFRNLRQKN